MSVEEIEHEIKCNECQHKMKVKLKGSKIMSINQSCFFFNATTFICEMCGSMIQIG